MWLKSLPRPAVRRGSILEDPVFQLPARLPRISLKVARQPCPNAES